MSNSSRMEPLVSVIIPTRNRREKLLRCVKSVLGSLWPKLEVVIVDDASGYSVAGDFADRRVRVMRNATRRLLAYSRNAGARASKGSLLFFLDDDNVVSPQTVGKLVAALGEGRMTAVVSPVIYRFTEPQEVWTSYIRKGRFPGFYLLGLGEPRGMVPTFSFHDAFMVRREVFERLGGFDDSNFPIHFGELDLAYRVQVGGYSCVVVGGAKVWHDVGRAHMHVDSVRSFYTLRNRVILLKRYESKRSLRFYTLCVLPPLTLYYAVHHLRTARDHRLRATFNLVRGVVSGVATPVQPFRPTLVEPGLKARAPRAGEGIPLVSVIVPTLNSAGTIRMCLASVVTQTYPRVEVIVVDNHSADGTASIARGYPGVKVLTAGPERGAQFNAAARLASGRYLYRVDSDFLVEPRVVEEAVSRCVNEGYEVVTVHNTSDPRYGFWARVRKLERDCYEDDDAHIAARFFDRSLFESVGGFDPALIAAEDYDLHNRLTARGVKVGRIVSKEFHIGEPRSLKEVVAKHFFYGTKITEFINKTPRSVWVRELSPVRTAYIRHWRSFIEDPKLTVGFLVYQYVRFSSAVAGYFSSVFR